MKTCVVFNQYHRQENKHRNLTSQIPPLNADVFAVSIEKYRFLMFI
jgi:hypothetical protein